jgi:hypothetical protein
MGWKTPRVEYVNGYKIIEVEGPLFRIYDGNLEIADFPYPSEAASHAKSLPPRDPSAP